MALPAHLRKYESLLDLLADAITEEIAREIEADRKKTGETEEGAARHEPGGHEHDRSPAKEKQSYENHYTQPTRTATSPR